MAEPTPTPVVGSWRGPDRVLVRAIAAASDGRWTVEETSDFLALAFRVMATMIREGMFVTITDIGKLTTRLKRKTDWTNGKRRIRTDRVAAVAGAPEIDGRAVVLDGTTTHRGEPYDPLP